MGQLKFRGSENVRNRGENVDPGEIGAEPAIRIILIASSDEL
jgi:hypothetical protein